MACCVGGDGKEKWVEAKQERCNHTDPFAVGELRSEQENHPDCESAK